MTMKNSKPRHTVFIMNLCIGIAALVSTSDHTFLFSVILLAVLIQIIILAHFSIKKLFNIPNLTLETNTLIYRGLLLKKIFELDEVAIEHKTFSDVSYYIITSPNASASIPDYNLSEMERDILEKLDQQKNAIWAN